MKVKFEIISYEYDSYEEYLEHAIKMVKNGWKFQSQCNNHKEVTWSKNPAE